MTTENQTGATGNTNQGGTTSTPPAAGATGAPQAGTQQAADDGKTAGADGAGGQDGKGDDGKAQGDANGDGKTGDEGKGDAKATGAPESYEDFKLPEGVQMDEAGLKSFSEFAKSMDLTQDAAQTFIEKLGPAMQARQTAVIETTRAGWLESLKTDKELGGDKFDETLQLADRGLKAVGSEALNKLLTESGLNKHPEIVRAFVKVGKEVSEDGKFVSGGAASAKTMTTAQRMFPNMNP
jgi:hypothetical protein